MYRVIVWTPLRVEPAAAWDAITDPAEVGALLPWGLRWEVSDPEGLRRALSSGDGRVFRTRLRVPWAVRDLPLRVVSAVPALRCAVGPPEGDAWALRMRLERALGGRLRLVHEVVLGPGAGRPAAALVKWGLMRLQRALAGRLGGADETRGRIFELVEAEKAHTVDLFGG